MRTVASSLIALSLLITGCSGAPQESTEAPASTAVGSDATAVESVPVAEITNPDYVRPPTPTMIARGPTEASTRSSGPHSANS